jgi:type I restriction enzyme S subunit
VSAFNVDRLTGGWKHVRFGDVVRQSKAKVDPEADGIERYVAGEHMDTDDLRIRRWGEVGDGYLGPAFHRYFKPGQILYGSRRTYLRKVAVADFEGVCANTTFVVESASADLLDEFLPYVMTSESFHAYSISKSKGSTNPYINFSDLAKYDFALPPLDEQQRIVELLSAADRVRDQWGAVAEGAAMAADAVFAELLQGLSSAALASLEDCCASPITYGIVQPGSHVPDGVPFVNVEDMTSGFASPQSLPRTSSEISSRYARTILNPNDVMVALRGPIGLSLIASEKLAGANLSRGVARMNPRAGVEPAYLVACMGSRLVSDQIRRLSTGSTFKELKIGALRTIRVPLPNAEVQRAIVERVSRAQRLQELARHQADGARGVRTSLLSDLSESPSDLH